MTSFQPSPSEPSGSTARRIRRPAQERSRRRFEEILDAAERLLDRGDDIEVGIYAVAAEAGIPAASVYHFFADMQLVYTALTERYLKRFGELAEFEVTADMVSWQDIDAVLFERARTFYNQSNAARRVLLGANPWLGAQDRNLDFNRTTAVSAKEALEKGFVLPEVPDLLDRLTEVIVINDALWTLSYHRYGDISDEMAEQARRARVAYGRTFLPEYLPRRPAAAKPPQTG